MQHEPRARGRFDRFGALAIAAAAFLIPVFFYPSVSVPFIFTKIAIAATLALVGLALFAFSRLGERTVALPTQPVMLGLIAVGGAYFFSTIFSSQSAVSLLGERIEPDSFGFVAIGICLAFLATAYLRKVSDILMVFAALLLSGAVLALFQLMRFGFGADALSMGGVFAAPSATPLGTLHDSAVFFGLIAVLALVTIVTLPMSRLIRLVVTGALIASLSILIVVNLTVVWSLVGLFALGTFVYSFFVAPGGFRLRQSAVSDTVSTPTAPGQLSLLSLIVLLLACLFVFGGQGISRVIWSKVDVGQIDIRPSWQTTLTVARPALAENPIFGSGPGTFDKVWSQYRPAVLNQTIAWNTDFAAAVGYIPTSIITTGIFGLVAWMLFLGLFVATGYAALTIRGEADSLSEFLILASFLGASYLWIIALTSNPAPALLLIAFLLTGVFLTSLRFRNRFPERVIDFSANPRLGFIAALVLTVVFLGSLASLIGVGQRYMAGWYFQKALVTIGNGAPLVEASSALNTALSLYESDRMYRLATDIGIARLNQIAAVSQNPTDEDRRVFQEELAGTVNLARRATEIDPEDYANWLSLGAIYQSLVPLQISGAYENAKKALETAALRRPQSPSIALAQAYLERSAQNPDGATTFAEAALAQRPIYTEAIFLLAQVAVEKNDLPGAIARVEAAVQLEPRNPVIYFQLGLLRYARQDFSGAAQALEAAVALNDQYANARYFLGLSYYRTNRTPDAITQFTRVQELNPENTEVAAILENLRNGRDPFGGAAAGLNDRTGPPIESVDDALDRESDAVIGEEQ
jgi:cytochrome c-type biogenesis protein CcmH/NrfG